MQPRDYQQAAFNAVIADLKTHKRVVVEMPTGSGKSLLAAMLAARVADASHKVWIITNRKELLEQNSATLGKLRPDLADATGIVSAGLKRDDRDADVLFGGVSSIASRMGKMSTAQKTIALLIIDEAHLVRPDDGQFQAVMKELEDINPNLRVVGLTASPFRLDLGPIVGKDAPFEKTSYKVEMRKLIDRGLLAPMACYAPKDAAIDLTGVRTVAGEYNQRDLEDAAMKALKRSAGDAARRLTTDLADRKSIIVFCSGVDHARAVAKLFNEAGIPSAAVSGEDDTDERDAKIAAFKSGKLRAIMNVNVLCLSEDTEILTSTGFVGIDDMTPEHEIAGWRQDGTIEYAPPKLIIQRLPNPGELLVTSAGNGVNFRVTENHRMVVCCGYGKTKTKVVSASELVGKRFSIPAHGIATPPKLVASRPEYKQNESRHRIVTAYHLRKRGYSADDADAMAAEQVTRLRSMRYKNPDELSIDECRLIGFWLGDGTKACGRVSFSQSMRYPDNIAWLDGVLSRTGIYHSRCEIRPAAKSIKASIRWTLARGTGGYGQSVERGYFELEPYLDKDGSPLLRGINREQLEALLHGFWLADGNHHHGRGHQIVGVVKLKAFHLLQELCVTRGISATIVGPIRARKPHHRDQWKFAYGGRDKWALTNPEFEAPIKGERVWCVQSSTSFLICRRKGKVFVTGNTTGFDHPSIDTVVDLAPTKSPVRYIQSRGRASRPAPGKQLALVLDYAGNTVEHGPLDMVGAPNKPGKGKGKAVMKTCPKCDHVEPGGAAKCSACGHTFEINKGGNLSHVPQAGDAMSLTSARWLPVSRMAVQMNPGKDGRPPTLRIEFRCNGNIGKRQNMYLSLEQTTANGFAYARSTEMWRRLSSSPAQPPPKTIIEAIMRAKTGELRTPKYIYAVPDGKFTRIDQVAFEAALGATS